RPLAIIVSAMAISLVARTFAVGSVANLISDYEKSLDTYRVASFNVSYEEAYDGFALPPGTVIEKGVDHIYRDDNKWKHIYSATVTSPSRGKVVTSTDSGERLYPDKGMIVVQMKPNSRTVHFVRAYLGDLPPDEKLAIAPFKYGLILNGSMITSPDVPLPEILRRSTLTESSEKVDGVLCKTLRGTGKWGDVRLWLDDSSGYLPKRLEIEKN